MAAKVYIGHLRNTVYEREYKIQQGTSASVERAKEKKAVAEKLQEVGEMVKNMK